MQLPKSFREVMFASVSGTRSNISLSSDVHFALSSQVPPTCSSVFIDALDSRTTRLNLLERTCNQVDYTVFDFSRFTQLEELCIANNSFLFVDQFRLEGFPALRAVCIGSNCFTKEKYRYTKNLARSFCVQKCPRLEAIRIYARSFIVYSGEFVVAQLPALRVLTIGDLNRDSYNFFYCSTFTLKSSSRCSREDSHADLPQLQSVSLGKFCFQNSVHTIFQSRKQGKRGM